MRFYTHITAGILFFVLFAYIFDIRDMQLYVGILIAALISVLPDIIDRITEKHRGMGHSLIILFPLGLLMVGNFEIGVAAVSAFISHIVFDIITVRGCPLLYPLTKTNYVALSKKRRIKTGTKQDKAVFCFLIILLIPSLLLITGAFTILPNGNGSVAAAGVNQTNQSTFKQVNVNINIDENTKNKKITIEKVNENTTTITIEDIT